MSEPLHVKHPARQPAAPATPAPAPTLGLWLGVLGVVLFGLTLPMTRLATGSSDDPQLSPWFVTFARLALAGGLSVLFLTLTRSPRPLPHQRRPLALAVAGNAIGFPLLLGLALREVTSGHAAVITALLPLATAAMAAWVLHQRARWGFWACAVLGAALVVSFALIRAHGQGGGFGLVWADALLVLAVLAAAVGYVYGAQVTPELGAERVICWVCVAALPLALPLAWWHWPQNAVRVTAWWGLLYVGVFSMWAGFFAWFRGLALGGALRVSQVQLLQPFVSLLAAVPLLGEPLEALTVAFALAVVGTVFLGKRLAQGPTASPTTGRPVAPSGPQATNASPPTR